MSKIVFFSFIDRLILYDQPVPGGHSYSVLRDQAEGEPADEGATSALHVKCQYSGLPL